MKKNNTFLALLAFMMVTLSSCQAIGDIFKAGVWVGVLLVVIVVVVIIWLVGKAKK